MKQPSIRGTAYLEAGCLLDQEGLVLLPLERLDLLGVVHLDHPLLHDITQQQPAVQRLGPVCVIIQHLVCSFNLLTPQLCPFLCIFFVYLNW